MMSTTTLSKDAPTGIDWSGGYDHTHDILHMLDMTYTTSPHLQTYHPTRNAEPYAISLYYNHHNHKLSATRVTTLCSVDRTTNQFLQCVETQTYSSQTEGACPFVQRHWERNGIRR